MTPALYTDVLVVGSGAGGLAAAWHCSQYAKVLLLTKKELQSGATHWAQGGIAAALGPNDSIQQHIIDTTQTGQDLCYPPIVEKIIEQAPKTIAWLSELGMPFTLDDQKKFALGQEGAHQHARIAHTADATGQALSTTLIQQILTHKNIHILPHHIGIDLICKQGRCIGLSILDLNTNNQKIVLAQHIILATGGANKVYLYTTQPESASGDGMAMAYRANCRLTDMCLNQFHPTCLYHPSGSSSLLTEAIRGEGGILTRLSGERFMHLYDDRAELAPRDVVARAMDYEMKTQGVDYLYLDISHKPDDWIKQRFPHCYSTAMNFGYNMAQGPLPVVPAAHYSCGGIFVHDVDGTTDLPGLYAIGETSCTGLHGANRLASNSLLECLVMSQACAETIKLQHSTTHPKTNIAEIQQDAIPTAPKQGIIVSHAWQAIRQTMWDHVGIVRDANRLNFAHQQINNYALQLNSYWQEGHRTLDLIECRNLVTIALCMIKSAQYRQESRGLHFRQDFPQPCTSWADQHLFLQMNNPQPQKMSWTKALKHAY